MPKKEFKIGEVFQCGLVKLKCVFSRNGLCIQCALYDEEGDTCLGRNFIGNCSESDREDKQNVIFVKVEE